MIETILDVPYNWFQAKTNSVPSAIYVRNSGVSRSHKFDVTINNPDILGIREWLKERGADYKLHGRFSISVMDYETRVTSLGVIFEFNNPTDCCLFKLFWV